MAKNNPAAESAAEKFAKGELLAAKRFASRQDALSVALADGENYAVEEAEAALESFLKGKVN